MRSLLLALPALTITLGAAQAQEPSEPQAGAPSREAGRWPSISVGLSQRWHRARVIYGVGTAIGLIGNGLTLSSVLVVAITDYPCNPLDPKHATSATDTCNPNSSIYKPPRPTDPAPLLAYMGASASVLGFVFAASGLGYEHHLLAEADADPGRGIFAGGTALGLLGFVAVGASYFVGFTDYLNAHDQGIAILASSITGTALCAIGGLLYTIDSSRMNRAWQRLSTF
jgi:hypothetical protein